MVASICYHEPTAVTVALAAILIVGTFISYVAQVHCLTPSINKLVDSDHS